MTKEQYENYLNIMMSTGADFAEVFYEDSIVKRIVVEDSKVDNIEISPAKGVGLRILDGTNTYYASSNKIKNKDIEKLSTSLSGNFSGNSNFKSNLKELEVHKVQVEKEHSEMSIEEKKKLLLDVDQKIRNYSSLITQVNIGLTETNQKFVIANSNNVFVEKDDIYTEFRCTIYAEDGGEKSNDFVNIRFKKGLEILEYELEKRVMESATRAVEKLYAENFEGGELPVVLNNGFGAVIFHEACGHGLEATSVGIKNSVFSENYGEMIASPKVTLIDDATLDRYWGSSEIDDEGCPAKKNVLIENGKLTNFLIDQKGSKELNMPSNGCGRRQGYTYAPTSRMSNTYLAPGTDKVEDMISSIKLGVYCDKMGGGSVNPQTGEFQFLADSSFLIEDGKITKRIKGITLIGTSKEILKNVEMVSDDLRIEAGTCGSVSGWVPVCIGQPTIKISKILVGGKK